MLTMMKKNNILRKIFKRFKLSEELQKLQVIHDNYGKPTSVLLNEIIDAGFNPIGITVMACEETFIFKTIEECDKASKQFLPEGWWYSIEEWDETRKWYVDKHYDGIEENAPIVYWLNDSE